MAVTSPDLDITLTIQDDCAGLTLTDATGDYDVSTNPFGYGLPGGPTVNNVTLVEIALSYGALDTTLEYSFTVLNGTITAATISLGGATPVSILSALESTDWPFSDGFDLTADYGLTIPDFEDDIYSVTYTISGTAAGPEVFDFSSVVKKSVSCQTECCIQKKFIALDPKCGCEPDAVLTALWGQALLNQATFSAQYGYTDKAIEALNKAKDLCDSDCNCG